MKCMYFLAQIILLVTPAGSSVGCDQTVCAVFGHVLGSIRDFKALAEKSALY